MNKKIDNYTNASRFLFHLRYSKEYGSSYLTGLNEIELKSLENYLTEALDLVACIRKEKVL